MTRFAYEKFADMQINWSQSGTFFFAFVSKSVHMDRFAHLSKFAYMQINTHVCKSVHVNGA